jgi:hypothetical protein
MLQKQFSGQLLVVAKGKFLQERKFFSKLAEHEETFVGKVGIDEF